MSARTKIVGIEARGATDYELLSQCNVSWLRMGCAFPFTDQSLDTPTAVFEKFIEEIRKIRDMGFRIMAITPCLGGIMIDQTDDLRYVREFGIHKLGVELSEEEKLYPDISENGIDRRYFQWRVPPWLRDYKTDSFYDTYYALCRAMATMTRGIIDIWQISNEMDIAASKGPLSLDDVIRFHSAGAKGIKEGDPDARCSINLALKDSWAFYIYKYQYEQYPELFDFAGTDGYFGTWHEGGPESWIKWIDKVYELTGKPVLIHEWGYSSAGGRPRPRILHHPPTWEFAWKNAHTEKNQAEYVAECLKIFAEHPFCTGSFFFRWADTETCTYCGNPDCPIESRWGLVEPWTNRKKPAFWSFAEAVKKYYR